MRFFDVKALIQETRKQTAAEFEKRHPAVAIVIERFVPAREPPTSDDVTAADTHSDVEPEDHLDQNAGRRRLKVDSRGVWVETDPIAIEPTITIGRDAKHPISLPNPRLSRHHATLRYSRSARVWFVLDEDSSNGTTLNGKTVRLARIADGDFIILG